MLGKFFNSKPKESWSDRTKAHRASLRADQEASTEPARQRARAESAEREDGEKPASTRKAGSKGFGKRNRA